MPFCSSLNVSAHSNLMQELLRDVDTVLREDETRTALKSVSSRRFLPYKSKNCMHVGPI